MPEPTNGWDDNKYTDRRVSDMAAWFRTNRDEECVIFIASDEMSPLALTIDP